MKQEKFNPQFGEIYELEMLNIPIGTVEILKVNGVLSIYSTSQGFLSVEEAKDRPYLHFKLIKKTKPKHSKQHIDNSPIEYRVIAILYSSITISVLIGIIIGFTIAYVIGR